MLFAWYKVSDKMLAANDVIGGQMTNVHNGETQQDVITSDMITEQEFGYIIGNSYILIAAKTGDFNLNRLNINIPEPGVYFFSAILEDAFAFISSLSKIIAHPFDDKYIPDTIARKAELDSRITEKEVILTSSTTDSTKKFKITVNDSGALTATEITK